MFSESSAILLAIIAPQTILSIALVEIYFSANSILIWAITDFSLIPFYNIILILLTDY